MNISRRWNEEETRGRVVGEAPSPEKPIHNRQSGLKGDE